MVELIMRGLLFVAPFCTTKAQKRFTATSHVHVVRYVCCFEAKKTNNLPVWSMISSAEKSELKNVCYDAKPLSSSRRKSTWSTRLNELKEFREKNGHCMVPQGHKANPQLARWVRWVRSQWKQGLLPKSKLSDLDELSFEYEPEQIIWDKKFDEVRRVCESKKSFRLNHFVKYPSLYRWITHQRYLWKNRELDSISYQKLNDIGFIWDEHFQNWHEKYMELKEFKSTHNHCNVPSKTKLGKWVVKQRHLRRIGSLDKQRHRLLNRIGFIWDTTREVWEDRIEQLIIHYDIFGHFNVAESYDAGLANWVMMVRLSWTQRQIGINHFVELTAMGFNWRE